VLGEGCVYPQSTQTLADQLTTAGKSWRAYIGGAESAPAGQPQSCRHPALGSADPNQTPVPGDPYVTWRNPFVYFQSLTSGQACTEDDVSLQQLQPDLASASKTPSFAYISPSRCQDGSEEPCAPGAPAGLAAADTFLEKVVPEIEASPAYKEGGLIAITSDQAPQSGPNADSSGCCTTSAYPNLPAAAPGSTTPATTTPSTTTTTTTTPTGTPAGGGKVGLLLISKYVKPGSVNAIGQYNHFSLLLSIEDLFGLKPLGYAAAPGQLPFDHSVFNAYGSAPAFG
jgi:phosphatidylinositol-3-phosphatase